MRTIGIKLEKDNIIEIHQVDLEKLLFVLSRLENDETLKFKNISQIEKLLSKYGLYDEVFLSAINDVW